jgi:hypothetical protein
VGDEREIAHDAGDEQHEIDNEYEERTPHPFAQPIWAKGAKDAVR